MSESKVFEGLISDYKVEKMSNRSNNVILAKKPTKVNCDEEYTKKDIEKGYKQIIQFNTWKKLYMLCNYNITSDFFQGRDKCFSSLQTYKNFIRGVVQGRYKEDSKLVKCNQPLYKFTKMMMEKGVKPYESFNGKSVSVFKLLTDPKLTKSDIDFIKSPISSMVEMEVPSSAIQPIKPLVSPIKPKPPIKPCQPIKPKVKEDKCFSEIDADRLTEYCLIDEDRIIIRHNDTTFLEGYKKALEDTIEENRNYKLALITFM